MRPRRTEQDTVHRESRRKLEEARFMKKECASTGKSLKKYLRGHLFTLQKLRIDRHLQSCALCKSELDARKRMEETRRILKYIDSPEGVAHRVKEGVSALTKLRMILYRPLWFAGLAVAVAALSYYAMLPRQIDLEIESIVKTAPVTTVAAPLVELKPDTNAATPPAVDMRIPASLPVAAPTVEPLAVSITPVNETTAVRRINEVMRGHAQLRNNKFSDDVREISGVLTARELLTFFNRIEDAGRASYSRKRLESFPSAQPIPFVMKLKAAPRPRPAEKPAPVQPDPSPVPPVPPTTPATPPTPPQAPPAQ